MGNFNLKFDRPKISSEEIVSKQNFETVLSQFNKAKPPVYKNPWFWGSAGLATIGLTTIVTLSAMQNKELTSNQKPIDDKTLTLKNTELPKDTDCIKPPIEGENIEFKTFKVNPLKDEKIVLESGTTIEIPKGSLLAENKSKKVDINIREFQDKSSVFISGIPMDYANNTAFESAGMIEIRGEQNNKEVKINPSKPLEIDLKTTKNPESFDFWYLNEKAQKWESFPTNNENQISSKNSSKTNQNNSSKAIAINKEKKEIQQIEVKIQNVHSQLSNLEKPKEEAFKIPKKNAQLFDLDFDKTDYPELATLKEVIFEVIQGKHYDASFIKKNWSDMDLSKDDEKYIMVFKNSKESFKTEVRPVVQGAELKVAEKKFDLAFENFKENKKLFEIQKKNLESDKLKHESNLNKLIYEEKIKTEKRNNQVQEDVSLTANREILTVGTFSNFISFQAPVFGVFNCDKPITYPKPFESAVAFLWIGQQIAKFKQLFIFDLDKNNRFSYSSVPGLGYQSTDNIGFHKNNDIVVVGIDFEGNVGYAEFKNRKNDKSKENNNLDKIVFTRKDKAITTLELLSKLLNEETKSV